MLKSTPRVCVFSFILLFTLIPIAHACMGVSRTINISSFKAHMGTGASGLIGLRNKEVVLTFDDGPVPGRTTKILATLKRECTKATFFVVGSMSRAYPKLLQRIIREGHTIGHHTQDHANLTHGSLAKAQRNIAAGRKTVRKALGPYAGRSSKLFRYPYLARSSALDAVIKRQGLLPFSAGVLSNDWKGGSGAAMVDRVMKRLSRTGRGVILLHDIQHKTAAVLPDLLRRLKRGGYKVVHVRTGRPSSNILVSSVSSKAPKDKTKNRQSRQIVLAKSTKPKRKRWTLFSRRSTSENSYDQTVTGSVKKTSAKPSKKSIKKARSKPTSKKQAAEETKKPIGLFAVLKQKREARKKRAEEAKKKAASKSKTTANKRKASKPKRVAKLKDTKAEKKKKPWFKFKKKTKTSALKTGSVKSKSAKKTETTQKKRSWFKFKKKTKTAALKKGATKSKSAKRTKSKKSVKKTKKTKTKKSGFFLTRNFTRQKADESDKAYHARLRARRLKLNQEQAKYKR